MMVAPANRVKALLDTPSRRGNWYSSYQPEPVAHCTRCGRIEPLGIAHSFETWGIRGADHRGLCRHCQDVAPWRKAVQRWLWELVPLAITLFVLGAAYGLVIWFARRWP